MNHRSGPSPVVLSLGELDLLSGALRARDDTIAGPLRRDGGIVCDVLSCAAGIPAGWIGTQDAGRFWLARRRGGARSGHRPGPSSSQRGER